MRFIKTPWKTLLNSGKLLKIYSRQAGRDEKVNVSRPSKFKETGDSKHLENKVQKNYGTKKM